jgi:hypothetical protein
MRELAVASEAHAARRADRHPGRNHAHTPIAGPDALGYERLTAVAQPLTEQWSRMSL